MNLPRNIIQEDIDAVKAMRNFERDRLKERINSAAPDIFFAEAIKISDSKYKLVCPNCGNGSGRDGTPVEVNLVNGSWLYYCQVCNEFGNGDHIKLIADEEHLNLSNRDDFCKALAIGAKVISYPLPAPTEKTNIKRNDDEDALPLIKADIAEAQKHLAELPESQRRGITLETFAHFHGGFIQKWIHPNLRLESYTGKVPAPSRRIILPTDDLRHYDAVALPADRTDKKKKYWKMHAGNKKVAFNNLVLRSSAKLIIVVEGELDAMSIWQASEGKIAVVAVMSAGGYKDLILPLVAEKKITDKQFLIMFDGGDDKDGGRKHAEKFRGELNRLCVPAVKKFLFDFLPKTEQQEFGIKVDFNDVLIKLGNEYLNSLLEKIIADAQIELNELEKNFSAKKKKSLTDEQRGYLYTGDLSDDDFADKIAFMYDKKLRYLENPIDEWLLFKTNEHGGGVWKNTGEKSSALFPLVKDLAEKLIDNAEDKSERDFGAALKETKKRNSVIAAVKGIERITITPDDLNNHNELLNCLNGVVNLQTGEFYSSAAPELMITQQANAVYRPKIYNEVVDKFLRSILPDETTCQALIRFLGYAATGECNEEKALFCNGGGGNGKGTLTKTLLLLYGDYGTALRTSAVLFSGREQDAGAATTELNPLENCRLAIVEELPQGGKLDVAKFKNLTGGDKIPIRRLHHEQINIEPHFSPILCGNYLPELSDTRDPGLLRRIMNIIFNQCFIGKERDPHLKAKLAAPDALSGFLSRIVDAAVLWYKEGLLESADMRQATKDYFEENDFIGTFIAEYCDRGNDLSIPRQQFLNKLKAKCASECIKLFGDRDRALTDAIKRIDGISYRRGGKGGGYQFFGVGWKGAVKQGTLDVNDNELTGEPVADDVPPPELGFDPDDTPFNS